MKSKDIFIDFEALNPEQVEMLSLTDFEMLDLKSATTLNRLYPDVYNALQARSEARREQAVMDRNYSFNTFRKPQPKAKPAKPKVDRTRMSYTEWQAYCDRQRGIEPSHTPSYREWVNARMNPTTQNQYKGRHS